MHKIKKFGILVTLLCNHNGYNVFLDHEFFAKFIGWIKYRIALVKNYYFLVRPNIKNYFRLEFLILFHRKIITAFIKKLNYIKQLCGQKNIC